MNTQKNKATVSLNAAPFQTIVDASRTTGLSQYYLRIGCRDGSVPHVKSGRTFLVNIPALLRKLDAESFGGEYHGQADC